MSFIYIHRTPTTCQVPWTQQWTWFSLPWSLQFLFPKSEVKTIISIVLPYWYVWLWPDHKSCFNARISTLYSNHYTVCLKASLSKNWGFIKHTDLLESIARLNTLTMQRAPLTYTLDSTCLTLSRWTSLDQRHVTRFPTYFLEKLRAQCEVHWMKTKFTGWKSRRVLDVQGEKDTGLKHTQGRTH